MRHIEPPFDEARIRELLQIGGVYYFRYHDAMVRASAHAWLSGFVRRNYPTTRVAIRRVYLGAPPERCSKPVLQVNIGDIPLPKIAEEELQDG